MVNVDANVAGMAHDLAQFLFLTGFAPPFPPRTSLCPDFREVWLLSLSLLLHFCFLFVTLRTM